jgi:tRNA A37 threonylcarbamoyltransferase TsaD
MDNAAMIAAAGYYKAQKKEFTDWKDLKADPNWEID